MFEKNKFFVLIRLLYPLNMVVALLVTAKTTLCAGGGQSSLRTRVTSVNFIPGGTGALSWYVSGVTCHVFWVRGRKKRRLLFLY